MNYVNYLRWNYSHTNIITLEIRIFAKGICLWFHTSQRIKEIKFCGIEIYVTGNLYILYYGHMSHLKFLKPKIRKIFEFFSKLAINICQTVLLVLWQTEQWDVKIKRVINFIWNYHFAQRVLFLSFSACFLLLHLSQSIFIHPLWNEPPYP